MPEQVDTQPTTPAEPVQQQESYLQSAYRLVSDALTGASTVAQDTAAGATTAAQDAYAAAPAVLPSSNESEADKKQEEESVKEAATPTSEVERREARIEETKAAGPSSESRIGKTQQEIGTETGIPTSAGPGTTLSADAKALEAARSNDGKAAHVPQDYTGEPCPSAFVTGETQENVPAGKSEGGSDVLAAATAAAVEKETAGQVEEAQSRSKRGAFADKLKGSAKILSGKIRRDEDKVEQGKAIKRGE